jgi:hypothetical protein
MVVGWYTSPDLTADIYDPKFADFYWPHKYTLGAPVPREYCPPIPGAFNYDHPDPAPTDRFCEIWRDKVKEVVDRYHPDAIYFDSRTFIIPEAPDYKSAGRIIRQLIDIVSKNGNLLLDVGPRCLSGEPYGSEGFHAFHDLQVLESVANKMTLPKSTSSINNYCHEHMPVS